MLDPDMSYRSAICRCVHTFSAFVCIVKLYVDISSSFFHVICRKKQKNSTRSRQNFIPNAQKMVDKSTYLYNEILTKSTIPNLWKHARSHQYIKTQYQIYGNTKVTPLHKDRKDTSHLSSTNHFLSNSSTQTQPTDYWT